MAEFTYHGVDKTGQKVTGKIDADTEGDLRVQLRQRGIRPTRILKGAFGGNTKTNTSTTTTKGANKERLPLEQLSLFTRQLQLLISSGVPLLQGLTILEEQADDKVVRRILDGLKENVSKGSFFWESLGLFPNTFPKLFVALCKAGEASGSLDQMLKKLGKYLESSERMRRMIKGAMMYPIIVVSVGIGVIVLMMIFVIPKFEDMLKGSGQALPAPTQFVIDASHFIINNILALSAGSVAFGYIALNYFRTAEGKSVLDRASLRLPVIGNIVLKGGVARFCRTMQTLLMAGVNVIDAVDICMATMDNVVLEQAMAGVRKEVETGKTLGMVLTKIPIFPKMAVQMISVGESTGNLDKMLEKISDYYEDEVEVLVGGLSKVFEPIILVFLGGTIGGLMIAMYLPIFKLAGGAE